MHENVLTRRLAKAQQVKLTQLIVPRIVQSPAIQERPVRALKVNEIWLNDSFDFAKVILFLDLTETENGMLLAAARMVRWHLHNKTVSAKQMKR